MRRCEENSEVQMFNVEMRLKVKSALKRRETELDGDHKTWTRML